MTLTEHFILCSPHSSALFIAINNTLLYGFRALFPATDVIDSCVLQEPHNIYGQSTSNKIQAELPRVLPALLAQAIFKTAWVM